MYQKSVIKDISLPSSQLTIAEKQQILLICDGAFLQRDKSESWRGYTSDLNLRLNQLNYFHSRKTTACEKCPKLAVF